MPPRDRPNRGGGADRAGRPGRPGRPAGAGDKRTERSQRGRPGGGGDDRRTPPGASDRRTDRPQRGRPGDNRGQDERTKSWGGVAKRGVGKLKPSDRGTASEAWRKAAKESDHRERGRMGGTAPDWQPEEWIDAGPVRDEAKKAVQRGTGAEKPRRQRPPRGLPDDVKGEVAREAGPAWAGRVQDRLQDAAKAFERERYRDALKLLAPLSERAPGSVAIRELHGLTLYRLGRWKAAIKELEVAELLGGSVEHHPVLMDAHRALGRHRDVERLWDELRKGGAGVDTMIEGRIVLAGSQADRGEVRDAVATLEQGPVNVRKPKDHHLRLWYALAAMYERAGDVPRARHLFGRVLDADPEFADVADRYEALS